MSARPGGFSAKFINAARRAAIDANVILFMSITK